MLDLPSKSLPGATLAVPELTLVVPTFNERDNVPLVVERVAAALNGVDWEIIFVDDDSADGTAAAARAIGRTDPRVRCIRRVGRRGLAGACIEGMLASQAAYVGVMDADLQHDETVLPDMLKILRGGDADLVIGSRYIGDGTAAEGFSRTRHTGSEVATTLARRILGVTVSDPMSGFFMLRREAIDAIAPRLATHGFKILADILTSSPDLRVKEVPYSFRARLHGDSKLDSQVALDFLGLLVARATRNTVPVRFVSFMLVGASGIVVHLIALKAALSLFDLRFGAAQTVATIVAMTSNFYLNNFVTYADQRLRGLAALRGLILFYLICAIGAVSNIGVATWLYSNRPSWWIAGLFGSIVGAVWNYALSSTLVWRR